MEEFFGFGLLWIICNYIGGTIRWIYGSICKTLFKKPKFKYHDYVFGPENSKNHFDIHGHHFNNMIITIIFIFIIFYIFS